MDFDAEGLSRGGNVELLKSEISSEKQAALATRLGVPWSKVRDVVAGDRIANEMVVRDTLDLAFRADSLDRAELERLARCRIYFETIMGWTIASDEDKRQQLASNVGPIQDGLRELCDAAKFSQPHAQRAWQLDGKFHKLFCEISGYNCLARVVDIVINRCKPWGIAACAGDILATWREHEAILAAIADQGDQRAVEESIFQAIQAHVDCAKVRWKDKEVPLKSSHSSEWEERALRWLRSRNSTVVLEAERAFSQELPSLLPTHYGKWVAFRGSMRLGFATLKTDLFRRCVASGVPAEELLIRRVAPQVEVASIESS